MVELLVLVVLQVQVTIFFKTQILEKGFQRRTIGIVLMVLVLVLVLLVLVVKDLSSYEYY
jgi:hypothetical protein